MNQVTSTIIGQVEGDHRRRCQSKILFWQHRLNSAQQNISGHIRKIGLQWKYARWVPDDLSQNLDDRAVHISALLEPDVNWWWKVDYLRKHRKEMCYLGTCKTPLPLRTLPPPKANLTLHKRMLWIWWDFRGPINYELSEPNEKLSSEQYCQELYDWKAAVQGKMPALFNKKDITLHHHNARHTARDSSTNCRTRLGNSVASAIFPGLNTTDYLLYFSLHNFLKSKKSQKYQTSTRSFFASRDETSFKNGKYKLTSRWQEVINNNGNYII